MSWLIATVSSITQALQGQKALEKYGINSYVDRNSNYSDTGGCGYVLKINADIETVKKIMSIEGVNITKFARRSGVR